MKVTYGIGKIPKNNKRTVVAIGVFDGVHVGHQTLLQQAVHRAKQLKIPCVVMTFSPHPVHVLYPQVRLPLITSLSGRLLQFSKLGIDSCVVVKFTRSFAGLSPEKFVKKYLVNSFRAQEIIVGDDFRFGQNRSGTLQVFRALGEKYDFKVLSIKPIKGLKTKISSTTIRQLISNGRLSEAKKMLGREVSIEGKVLEGEHRGKTLGFPTANIVPHHEVIPMRGVYIVSVEIENKKFKGMANVGYRPTFHSLREQILIETHIFNFDRIIYGKQMKLNFLKKIREEKMFNSKEQLIEQIKRDARVALNYFK